MPSESSRSIQTYDQFAAAVDELGFMPLSDNTIGYPNLASLTTHEAWHTGLDTDPWLWKNRIVADNRAAYAKLFAGKPGFVALSWYPAFLAVRRQGRSLEQLYQDGLLSHAARQIHRLFTPGLSLATHEIKARAGLGRDAKGEYERAMVELQMRMFITTCGMARMTTADGEPHSWPATEYSRVEDWAGVELMRQGLEMDPTIAAETIRKRLSDAVGTVDAKKALRFIGVPGQR